MDIDIPRTGAVALYYLSRQMVLCPWQLPRLHGPVDLLWNYISFQELEPAVVRFYLGQAACLGARYVLLRNLREGKQKRRAGSLAGVDEPILGGDCGGFLPAYRLLATNVHPFGRGAVDGFHSELRLYALK